jgi:hypothetical protein
MSRCVFCGDLLPDYPHNCHAGRVAREQGKSASAPESILSEAARIVGGDRHAIYGAPAENHQCTADLATSFFRRRYGSSFPALTAEDVCMFNILQKCAREANTPKRDNRVDLAGYAENLDLCCKAREKQ